MSRTFSENRLRPSRDLDLILNANKLLFRNRYAEMFPILNTDKLNFHFAIKYSFKSKMLNIYEIYCPYAIKCFKNNKNKISAEFPRQFAGFHWTSSRFTSYTDAKCILLNFSDRSNDVTALCFHIKK